MFNCKKCGKVKKVLIDGYNFGDRLLEGVMFFVWQDGKKWKAEVKPECHEYFKSLNTKMWLKRATIFAAETDMFECSNCGGDIEIEEIKNDSIPIKLKCLKASDLIQNLTQK